MEETRDSMKYSATATSWIASAARGPSASVSSNQMLAIRWEILEILMATLLS